MEPSKEPTDAASTTIYIIASCVGATVLFILLLVIVPILAPRLLKRYNLLIVIFKILFNTAYRKTPSAMQKVKLITFYCG